MAYANLRLSFEGPVGTLTVDRPDVRNALDTATVAEFHAALEEVRGRRAVVLIVASSQMPLAAGLAFESTAQAVAFESYDKQEGTTAFLEKRKPNFKGE